MKNEIEVRYEKAVEQAREAIEELRLAASAKGYEDAKRDLQAVAPTPKFTPITAQEHRDEIVEMAKRDVAELAKNGFARNEYGDKRVVKFIVNKDKRTAVVLLRGCLSGNVYEKGIAKCAPTDCFNAAIGRAIALRRALGLEVPAEYTNAPQPTEVRVGDIVRCHYFDGYRPDGDNTYFEDRVVDFDTELNLYELPNGEYTSFNPENNDRIIDDSRGGDNA